MIRELRERIEQSPFVNAVRETMQNAGAGVRDMNDHMERRRPRFDGSETSKIVRKRAARRKRGLHGKF